MAQFTYIQALPNLLSQQAAAELLVNSAWALIDAIGSSTSSMSISLTGVSTLNLTVADQVAGTPGTISNDSIVFTGSPSGTVIIQLPLQFGSSTLYVPKANLALINNTSQSLTVKASSSGVSVSVPAGTVGSVTCDGTNMYSVTGGGNTTFDDSTFRVYNHSNSTKNIAFSAASITTGTTRTYTWPNLSDTVATVASTATFTNKTYDTAGTGNAFSINGTAITAVTGTGNVVLATAPTLGAITVTSVNKLTVTQPATGSTLTIADGKTLTANNSLTLAGTDGTTLTFQGTGTYTSRTSTDTFTNKSIDGATNTLTNISATSVADTVATGVSAAGTNSATATLLTALYSEVNTVGAGQGVRMFTSTGQKATIVNSTTTDLKLYPPTGSSIDGLGTNNAYIIPGSGSGGTSGYAVQVEQISSGEVHVIGVVLPWAISAPANLDVLAYTSSTGLWGNIASTGTGTIVRNTSPTMGNLTISDRLAVGGSGNTANIITVSGSPSSGATSTYGIRMNGHVFPSTCTAAATAWYSYIATTAAAYTLTNGRVFYADDGLLGAASTLTNQIGYYAGALTIGVNNYGFYGDVASGSNRFNLYMPGTASNHLAGGLYVGYTADQGGGQKLQVNGDIFNRHLYGSSSTPTISAGAGAGTGPTVSVTGNDSFMQVTVTTGTLPTGANATIATVTYNANYGSTPHPVFSIANTNAALLSGASMVAVDGASSSTFTITSGTTALTASTTYKWNIYTGA